MKAAAVIKQLAKKRNRIISGATRVYRTWSLRLKVLTVRLLAELLNRTDGKAVASIPEVTLPASDGEKWLTVNCMGLIDAAGERDCLRDIRSLGEKLGNASLSFAVASDRRGSHLTGEAKSVLRDSGVTLLCQEGVIGSRIFRTDSGSLGVITFDRSGIRGTGDYEKLLIMRHILALKRRAAEYMIVYVTGGWGEDPAKGDESRLCKVLSQMGADYIVGVTPDRRDGGSTYQKPGGGIARSVYSVGTFLSGDREASPKRVLVRLKLGAIRGRLQLVEETYVPCCYLEKQGLVSLLDGQLSGERAVQYRAEIEDELRRLRPADRILTVGKVMELIGAELPEAARHLKDFSVGKICARSFEVMPGDLFFFREPFMDPNDLETPSPRRRLKIARKAAKKGAMLLVTYRPLPFSCVQVLHGNVMEAHIAVCAQLRRQYKVKTIAVTGSVGKTSTKDMLAEVMRMRYQTVKSERNANVQVKIGMNLQELNSGCEIFIQEIGGGRPGGASRHSRMVLPQVAVVTNIGDAHIGNFGSREKLLENKLGIVDGMSEDGTLYLNADDPMLAQVRLPRKTVFFAVHNTNADYYAEELSAHGGYCSFRIVHNGNRTPVTLRVLGEYNVLNAVCCFAVAKQFGIPDEDIVTGLSHFYTTGIRQNLMEVCGRKLFMDCYNASTESVRSAMEILTQIRIEPGKKRIAVVGDITGMGVLSKAVHQEIGHTIREYPVDHVLLFGEDVKYTYEILKEAGVKVCLCGKREELNQMLQRLVDVGDVAVFKGSSKMLLESSVDMVYGTRLTDQRLQDEREFKSVRKGAVLYDLYANYATAEEYSPLRSGERRIQIAGRVGGIEVVNMGRALQGRSIAQVTLPDSIRHISAEAFMECTQLTELRMPKRLKYIGKGAFKNCRSLREVKLPENVLHIGARAFSGCSGLRKVTIPASVVQIGKDAFYGCEKCQFICPKDSYAQRYLLEAGFLPQVQ